MRTAASTTTPHDGDQTAIGGAPETVAGYGPNTRTIMQFQVDGPAAAPFDLERLRRALPAAYVAAQDPVLVPTEAYRDAYGAALGPAATLDDEAQDDAVPVVPQEESGTLTFTPLGRAYRLTLPAQGKMVSDLFDPTYGRMTATLGVDAPLSANGVRTAVPYSADRPRHRVPRAGAGGVGAAARRRHPDLAHHARRHDITQRGVRGVRRAGAVARAT